MTIANWLGFGLMLLGTLFNIKAYAKARCLEHRATYALGSLIGIFILWLLLMAAIGRG